jgi:hypothetical protein
MTAGTYADDLATTTPSNSERAAVLALPKSDERAAVDELNQSYAVVLVGDRPAILREGFDDEGRPKITLLSVGGFHEWMRPRKVWVKMAGGNRPLQASKLWMDSEQRRQFDGVTFVPEGEAPPGYYNLWKGFAVEPDPNGGSFARFLEHVAENVCNGDEQHFLWVMGWFAQIVQQPARKLGTSLVFRGPQGAGKSIVGEEIGKGLGIHYQSVSDERFVIGRFNSHLANCVLLQIEEATWGGDHAAAGKLKDLITGPYQLIEYKGKEPVRVRSYVRVHITSNNDWVVPAGLEERRFTVLDIGEKRLQDGPYFQKMREELDAGGRAALMHYLLHYDLSGLSLRTVLATDALRDQKIAGMTPEMAWWLDILMNGDLPGDAGCEGRTPKDVLYEHYIAHAQRRGINRRSSDTVLGGFLKKYVPELRQHRPTITDPKTGVPDRIRVYDFPPLAACRAHFDRVARSQMGWPDPEMNWGNSS